MTLLALRNTMRLLLACFIITLVYWVYFSLPDGTNITIITLFQILPLLLISPLFIHCRSPHLHIALPVIMIYMCFTAPNLFLDGQAQIIAGFELGINIVLSSLIMWYLLQVSQQQRRQLATEPSQKSHNQPKNKQSTKPVEGC